MQKLKEGVLMRLEFMSIVLVEAGIYTSLKGLLCLSLSFSTLEVESDLTLLHIIETGLNQSSNSHFAMFFHQQQTILVLF